MEEKNHELRKELKEVFASFYDRHVDENDPQTCILKIRITETVAFDGDYKYTVDYQNGVARRLDCKIQ